MEPPADVTSEVVERARLGDHAALSVLFKTYQPALLRYLRGRLPGVADDLAAQTWLDAARNVGAFSGGPDDFRRWLFTIARRRVQDELRRRSRRPEQLSARPPETTTGIEEFEAADELARALALVRQLSPDQADAVLLRIVADMDVGQVAEVMGRSEGAVRVLVHRGLQRLRDLLSRAARIMV
jgi:RNA polymerase sigma-70 factor (ECF subfamily)